MLCDLARRGRPASRSRCRPAASCNARSSAPPSSATRCMFASELEFFLFRESLDEAAAKGYTNLTPHSNVDRGLPHPPDDSRRVPDPRDPQRRSTARACPSSSRRARRARASTRSTSRTPTAVEMADRHVIYKNGAKEIAAPARPVDHVHGEVLDGRGRLVVPRALEPVGHRRRRAADVGRRRARPPVARVPRLARRPDRVRPRARVDVRPDRQLVQALPARVVGADRARVERRQPHVRVPRRRPRPVVPARVAHPRRRREPVPRVRGDDRGRPARHRARHRAAAALRRQRVRGRRPRARAVEPRRGDRRVRDARRSRSTRSAPTCTTTCSTPRARSGRTSTARSPTGNAAATSTSGERNRPPDRAVTGRRLGRTGPVAAHRRERVARAATSTRVARAGGDPAARSIRAGDPSGVLDRVDALVLTGGPDLDPATYGADAAREDLRRATAASTTSRSRSRATRSRAAVPTLAICRGLQVLNVALGGTLHQHIPEHPGVEPHGRPGEPHGGRVQEVDDRGGHAARQGDGHEPARRHLSPPPGGRPSSATTCASSPAPTTASSKASSSPIPTAGSSPSSGTPRTPPPPTPPTNASSTPWSPKPVAPNRRHETTDRWFRTPVRVVASDDGGAELVLGDLAAGVAGHDVDDLEPLGDLLGHEAGLAAVVEDALERSAARRDRRARRTRRPSRRGRRRGCRARRRRRSSGARRARPRLPSPRRSRPCG